jgi:hypothetical protein
MRNAAAQLLFEFMAALLAAFTQARQPILAQGKRPRKEA